MKQILILRGIPGAGKSTYIRGLRNPKIASADHFFERSGTYKFDVTKISEAHQECFKTFLEFVFNEEELIVVDNTSISSWEISPYMLCGQTFGYEVKIVTFMTPPEQAKNVHGVPEHAVKAMYQRLLEEKLPPWWPNEEVRRNNPDGESCYCIEGGGSGIPIKGFICEKEGVCVDCGEECCKRAVEDFWGPWCDSCWEENEANGGWRNNRRRNPDEEEQEEELVKSIERGIDNIWHLVNKSAYAWGGMNELNYDLYRKIRKLCSERKTDKAINEVINNIYEAISRIGPSRTITALTYRKALLTAKDYIEKNRKDIINVSNINKKRDEEVARMHETWTWEENEKRNMDKNQ